MKVEYLYDIVAIYNQKSIKKAALERDISEETFKKHIENIEKEVGKILYNVTSNSLELTAEGMEFYMFAMKSLEGLIGYKNRKKKLKEKITIAMDVNVFLGSMHTCSDAISKKYNIKFEILYLYKNDVINGVISEKYDTGLIILDSLTKAKLKEQNLFYEYVCTRRPVIIVSNNHPLAKYKEISLKHLEEYQRISLKNSFEETYFFNKNSKVKLSRSNMVYKYIADVLLSLKYGQFYFIGGCNEEIDLGLNGLSVIEITELKDRVEVGCIYPMYKPFLQPLKEIINLSEEIKTTKE